MVDNIHYEKVYEQLYENVTIKKGAFYEPREIYYEHMYFL